MVPLEGRFAQGGVSPMQRSALKPSKIVPVSAKITAYESSILDVLSEECNMTKSAIIRIAILRLFLEIFDEELKASVRLKLPPGYELIIEEIASEGGALFRDCMNRLLKEDRGK